MRSNVRVFARRRQMSGWLNDIADKVLDQGKAALDQAVSQKSGQVGGDHIAQQNWTVDQFRQILDAVNAGTLDPKRAAQLVESLAANFEKFAAAYGPRGFQGARDVRTLANQIKQSLTGALSIYSNSGLSTTLQQNWPLVLLGLGGLYFVSRRRRSS